MLESFIPSSILYNTASLSLSRSIHTACTQRPVNSRPGFAEDAILTELTHHNVIYGIVALTSPIRVPTCQRKWLGHCESLAQKIRISEHKAPITVVIILQHTTDHPHSGEWMYFRRVHPRSHIFRLCAYGSVCIFHC